MEDPYVVLGIAPTLELGEIKRAYFRLLPRHLPHADPAGFRRLRDAYERLLVDTSLLTAYVSAELDIAGELARVDAELAERTSAARSQLDASEDAKARVKSFTALLRLELADARARVRSSKRA